jgi:anti-sigma B factor antagonist
MEIPSQIRVDQSSAGVTVLELVGEHDLASADKLALALTEALACEGGIIIDLSESTFADSTVINLMYRTQRALDWRGRELVVQIPVGSLLLRTLEITHVTSNLTIVHDREAALAKLSAQAQAAVGETR